MKNKLYNTGVIIGGFQPFHIGHEKLVNTALELCNDVYIYLGNRKTNEENMLSFDTRKRLIEKVYKNYLHRVHFFSNEYKNKNECSEYILELFWRTLPDNKPDIIIHGDEDIRRYWFNQNERQFNELFIPRNKLIVSGTKIRDALIKHDYNYCKGVINLSIIDELDNLRNELIEG